jgi:tellurite resistance protein TerB
MFGALKKRFTDALDANLGRFAADKDLLEGAMAACAMIAAGDGQIEAQERQKTAEFVRRHPSMKHFDGSEAGRLFLQFCGEFDFDAGMGQTACLKQISEVRGDEKRTLVMQLALAIAKSDGEFEPGEKVAATKICDTLGLSRSDFGL